MVLNTVSCIALCLTALFLTVTAVVNYQLGRYLLRIVMGLPDPRIDSFSGPESDGTGPPSA